MTLVRDWKQVWRYYSAQALGALVIIQTIWLSVDDETKASIPADWVAYISLFLAFTGGIGRLIKQRDAT